MRICRKGISFSGRSDMHEQVAGSSAWSLPSSVTSQAVRVQRRVITSRGRVSDHTASAVGAMTPEGASSSPSSTRCRLARQRDASLALARHPVHGRVKGRSRLARRPGDGIALHVNAPVHHPQVHATTQRVADPAAERRRSFQAKVVSALPGLAASAAPAAAAAGRRRGPYEMHTVAHEAAHGACASGREARRRVASVGHLDAHLELHRARGQPVVLQLDAQGYGAVAACNRAQQLDAQGHGAVAACSRAQQGATAGHSGIRGCGCVQQGATGRNSWTLRDTRLWQCATARNKARQLDTQGYGAVA
eukprot:350253-Chlamydomonas_euryale.AAC.1